MLNTRKLLAGLSLMLMSLGTLSASTDMNVKVNGCKGPILCSNFPILTDCEECCHTWHVDVGLLFEQPAFGGMVAGTSYVSVFAQDTDGTFQNQTVTPLNQCFDYTPGLTVSLGYLSSHDDWFGLVRFDWLSATIKQKEIDQNGTDYKANSNFDVDVLVGSGFNYKTAAWESLTYKSGMDIYSLDFLLSRGAFISRCYSLEPFMGVKALWFNTSQVATYYNPTIFSGNSNRAVFDDKQTNWGAGLMFGLNGEYHFTHGVAFFSDNDVSVLYGQARRTVVSTLTNGGSITSPRVITNKNLNDCGYYVPVRTTVGLKLSRYCLEDEHFVAVKIGFDARTILAFPENESGYSMNGLLLDFVWDF